MTELQGLLERLVRVLDGAGVPFMIAGSFASAAYIERWVRDLDLADEWREAQEIAL